MKQFFLNTHIEKDKPGSDLYSLLNTMFTPS